MKGIVLLLCKQREGGRAESCANALLKRETGPMDVSLNLYMKRWEAKEGVER